MRRNTNTRRWLATWLAICAMGLPAAFAGPAPARPWMDTHLSADQRAELLLKAMTLDEKFQLIRSEFGDNQNGHVMSPGALGSAGYVPALTRLGWPAMQESDAGLGVAKPLSVGATALPSALATTASFDPRIAHEGGAMIGSEAHKMGFNVLLAGGIDLQRDPRDGRNFEYAGEDPLLAGTMVAAAVRGIQSQHVLSTVKHYAINDLETARTTMSADIDPAAARESDLLAFEIAIAEGKPGAVMCSYNRVNGVYACENEWLLDKVLKHDWGFPGFVMSDWGAVHSAAKAALAGLDQESAGETFDAQVYFDKPLRAALADGSFPQARLDDMVRRILRSMIAVGALDYPTHATPQHHQPIDYAADRAVAQHAEEAGAVLLRNADGLLPLSGSLKSVAVIGAHADRGVVTGGGSSLVQSPQGNPVPGLEPTGWPGPRVYQPDAPLAAIARLLPHAQVRYASGEDIAAAAKLAAQAQVAVVFVQQWSAESFDLPTLALPGNQDALVAAVAKANPHTVVVLENDGPVDMPWLDSVGAVLEAWYPGAGGGEAIARLLCGQVAPAGRLPFTWPRSDAQLPRPSIPGAGLPAIGLAIHGQPQQNVDYRIEGADVGYRWFQKQHLTPLFPFGYGLTYTSFVYSKPVASVVHGRARISFEVRNTGTRAGTDVPQLYAALAGHTRRLAGWRRVTLAPGASTRVSIEADPRVLLDFDVPSQTWWRAAGPVALALGHDATDLAEAGQVDLPAVRVSAVRAAASP